MKKHDRENAQMTDNELANMIRDNAINDAKALARLSGHLTRFNTGLGVGSRSNAEIRRRNGGVKHQFEDDIGGCSANYQ